ncbi:pentapeptide repeat-containing protein [Kibdelosporangium aridum]|uniref:pentapeptide repeat-containing protein n=1 Tax=Kibdelosporangium aridum TaxID=2030 RepID=UPI0035EDEBFA
MRQNKDSLGYAWFGGAAFTGVASFDEAVFTGTAWFGEATADGHWMRGLPLLQGSTRRAASHWHRLGRAAGLVMTSSMS